MLDFRFSAIISFVADAVIVTVNWSWLVVHKKVSWQQLTVGFLKDSVFYGYYIHILQDIKKS
jgi:hypothetical protein